MPGRQEPSLPLPRRLLLGRTFLLAIPVLLWWLLIYHGANWLTNRHAYRVRIHLDAELAIPFVPPLIFAYLSISLVFVVAPFFLRSRRELEALALSLLGVTTAAGICFLLFPAELAYSQVDPGSWSRLFTLARDMALRYNLVPSLHVAMSCLCLAVYSAHCGWAGKALLGTWGMAIVLSTLLTHQHHVLDVVTGLILAAAGKRFIYDGWRARPAARQRLPAIPRDGREPPA